MAETIQLEVTRYSPEHNAAPAFQCFEVPYRKDWVVLDALNYIKDKLDGSLSYRWSCRMGICGSCGMMVNGEPKLTCATFLSSYAPDALRVEPLRYFPVVRDLVIEMTDFMVKLQKVKPWIIRKEEKSIADGEYLQTPQQLDVYKQFSMCINCMLCYAACPVYEELRFQPIHRARGVAQHAVNAHAELLVVGQLLGSLEIFPFGNRLWRLGNQPGLELLQLVHEVVEVDHQVANDRKVGQRFDADGGGIVLEKGGAGQLGLAVDHHAAAAAHAHAARPAIAERAVEVVLDVVESIE